MKDKTVPNTRWRCFEFLKVCERKQKCIQAQRPGGKTQSQSHFYPSSVHSTHQMPGGRAASCQPLPRSRSGCSNVESSMLSPSCRECKATLCPVLGSRRFYASGFGGLLCLSGAFGSKLDFSSGSQRMPLCPIPY